jgi:ribosomal protein S27E
MSDRKYRQRGYQDSPREPRRDERPPEKKEYAPRGQPPLAPKTFNMPGFREVVRCTRCGHELTVASAWSVDATCPRCSADLHTCAQCVHFDTGAPFECQQPIPMRISPKDARNACTHYEPRTTVERETKSTGGPPSARKAFDDLFK